MSWMDAHVEQPVTTEPRGVTWGQILLAGGAGWVVVTVTVILWMWPLSGTEVGDTYYLSTPARITQHLLVFALSVIAYRIAFTHFRPLWRKRPLRFIALHLVLALTVITLAPLAAGISSGVIDHRYADLRDSLTYWRPFTPVMTSLLNPMQFFLPPYLLGMALIALVQVARDYHAESLRSARLWAAYSEARLAMLSAQLQPHFLFNALHAITELVEQNPRRAKLMLARLGDFLRHALESSKQPWVSVATEVAGLEAYLAVQQARYSDRLAVELSVDPAVQSQAIPSMLLQPLAENAVEHGRCGPSSALTVAVAVTLEHGLIHVVISNSTPTLPAVLTPGLYRTGLSNVHARLRAAYGAEARLIVGPAAHGGTTAILDLPLKSKP
jgi:GNAT superfamily N-acetyltransferase